MERPAYARRWSSARLAYRLAPVGRYSREVGEMKRLVLVLALVAAVAATLSVGSAVGAVKTAKSTVTIASGEGTEFTGKVSSAKKQCREDRKVTLYMKPYDGSADVAVGSDKTDASGAWTIEGSFAAGIYYARVASTLVHAAGVPIRCAYDWTMPARF
jgi:hypothetical protein